MIEQWALEETFEEESTERESRTVRLRKSSLRVQRKKIREIWTCLVR
jgi:hypothetical protein